MMDEIRSFDERVDAVVGWFEDTAALSARAQAEAVARDLGVVDLLAESEALKEALRSLVDNADRGGYGVMPGRFSDALEAARALVGSVPQPAEGQ